MKPIKLFKETKLRQKKAVIKSRLPERKIPLRLIKEVNPIGEYMRFPLEFRK